MNNQNSGLTFGDKLGLIGQGIASMSANGPAFNAADATQKVQQMRQGQQQQNMTKTWIAENAPDLLPLIDAGVPPAQVWGHALKQQAAQKEQQKRIKFADQFYANDPQKRQAFIHQFDLPGGSADPKLGMNPIYGTDADGNQVIMQLSSDGQLRPAKTPEGYQPTSPYEKSFDTSRGREAGKQFASGEATAASDMQSADSAIRLVDDLLADPALDSVVGGIQGRLPTGVLDAFTGNKASGVQAKIDQLKGKTFLEAYSMLKGGGQITEVEGIKAEQAMARLSQAQNEEDFKAALREFRDAVEQGRQKLLQRYGVQSGGAVTAPAAGGADDPLGIR